MPIIPIIMSTTCDILKGLATGIQPVIVTIAKDDKHSETWDWTGCVDGSGGPQSIRYVRFFITKPRNKNGQQQNLKPGSISTSVYKNGILFIPPEPTVIDLGDVSNSVVVIVVHNLTKQNLDVEYSYSCIIGG